MSGPEIVGVIAGIIGILDAVAKVYNAVSNTSGLPVAFRDVAGRLPLVQETLQTVRQRLNCASLDEGLHRALKPTADACKDKASRLEEIFRKVVPQESASRIERYALAMRILGKESRVESLMKGVLEDVRLLADNHVMKLATEAELRRLFEASKEVTSISLSLQDEIEGPVINNYGSGFQNVNTGDGPQNNNNGSGQQFIGSIFNGFSPHYSQETQSSYARR